MKRFLVELASIPTRTLNVFLGGTADLTTSAQSHRDGRRIEKWIDRIFFWQKNHCRASWNYEVQRSKQNVARADAMRG